MDIHQKIKHPCNQCDFKAASKKNLRVHIQNIHEGIKHPCNYCDYQATQSSNMSLHMKKKHGEIYQRSKQQNKANKRFYEREATFMKA